VAGTRDVPGEGWYCPPRVVADVDPAAAVLREEVFGPLLTVERVASMDQAFTVVESLPYALTAGVFSRSPATVREAAARLPVGNLYVNRAITGARVGQQPFGGNRRSGVGSKAGGPDYLLQFTEPRVTTENVMRHGIPME
jgi:RHH-type proline utilization regulon transcriptional repressor/proline dehydrogenase/delta 1-pyrroline-5-carboxylate dehydrogenase